MQLYGGGSNSKFIEKMCEFATAAVPDNRRIPSYFWGALAKLNVEADALSPFVVWGCVKTEAKAPGDCVSGSVTNYIKPNEIGALVSKKKLSMVKANSMMEEYHEIADGLDWTPESRASVIDRADILMCKLLLGKDVDPIYKSFEVIAAETIQSMIDSFPQLKLTLNPYQATLDGLDDKADKPAEQAKTKSTGLIEYSNSGLSLIHI